MIGLGYHASVSSKRLKEDLYAYKDEGTKLVQIFLGSPRTLTIPEIEPFQVPIETIVHGPFVTSLVTDYSTNLWKKSLKYYVALAKLCSTLDIRKLVVHVGGIREYQSMRSGYTSLLHFCYTWLEMTEGTGVTLCLENDAGSSTGRKIGSLSLLYKAITYLDNERLKLTFDTEHAYANGFDLNQREKVNKLLEICSVVHLNAIPENVKFGGHLDRHSHTRIVESKEGPDQLIWIAKQAYDRGIPMILERKDMEVINDDIRYITEKVRGF